MADEAVITELFGNNGDKMEVTVASGTAIPKGSLMVLTDPRSAVIHAAVDTPFVGIADFEKSATDGKTKMTVVTNCIAKLQITAAGSTTIGDTVSLGDVANHVTLGSTLDDEKGWTVGKALEDGAGGDTVLVRVKALS